MMEPIYCLSGWGFSGDILLNSVLKDRNALNLNYFHLERCSIQEIVAHLSCNTQKASVIVAWSLGGLIAVQLAALFPEQVKKLVLLSSQPKFMAEQDYPGISHESMQSFIDLSLQDFEALKMQFIRSVGFPNKRILKKLEDYSLKDRQDNLIHLLNQMMLADLRQEYASLRMDILHIIAKKDAVIKQDESALLALNANAYILSIDDAGHAGFLTHTKLYTDLIERFLDE